MSADSVLSCAEARALMEKSDVVLVDLREAAERERDGVIPGSLHAPFPALMDHLAPGGALHDSTTAGKRLVFYCAKGPRSAMAAQAAAQAGFAGAGWIEGGLAAWDETGGPIMRDG